MASHYEALEMIFKLNFYETGKAICLPRNLIYTRGFKLKPRVKALSAARGSPEQPLPFRPEQEFEFL
jgi:hypothetical protein